VAEKKRAGTRASSWQYCF